MSYKEIVETNDTVRVSITTSEGNTKKQYVQIIDDNFNQNINQSANVRKITLESPLAAAIYGKEIGSSTPYKVGTKKLEVTIEEKIGQEPTKQYIKSAKV